MSAQKAEPRRFADEVAEGVRRFDDGLVNWYLVADGDRVAAIDAGFPSDWSALVDGIAELGLGLDALSDVVITHGHIDHIGFAERARRETGATVHVHEKDAPLLRHPLNVAKSERSPLRYLNHRTTRKLMLAALRRGAPIAKTVSEYRTFGDGDVLEDVPGRPRVVFTPGHSAGHSSLHLPERDVLFAGDAVVMRDPYTGATGPQIVSAAATADTAQALRSLDRIAATGAGIVLTGHGEPWTDGAAEAARQARAAGAS